MLRVLMLLRVYTTQATIKHFSDSLAEYDNELIHDPKFQHETQKVIDQTQSAIYAFTHPVVEPNDDTVQEVNALTRFSHLQCGSALQLFDFAEGTIQCKMHENAIMGGYIVMILMSKVPGSALKYDTFYRMSLSQRTEVREAFRHALMQASY
jgi:hypothetical protein